MALKMADPRNYPQQKGKGSICNIQALHQSNKALRRTLVIVLFRMNPDDKLMSEVPSTIQEYFTVPQGYVIVSVISFGPGCRCREHEKIPKGMGRYWVGFLVLV